MTDITLSSLPHTWLIDIDGTVVRHNGHKRSAEELLDGVCEFWAQIPREDQIVLLSARTHEELNCTLAFLDRHGLRYDHVLFSLPAGERILINDDKPSGLKTALAVTVPRDVGLTDINVRIDPVL